MARPPGSSVSIVTRRRSSAGAATGSPPESCAAGAAARGLRPGGCGDNEAVFPLNVPNVLTVLRIMVVPVLSGLDYFFGLRRRLRDVQAQREEKARAARGAAATGAS